MSDAVDNFQDQILFKPASWHTRVDFINHLILFNNIMMVVLTEKNGGKTSFIRMLTESLDAQVQHCSILAEPCCSAADIAQQLNNKFACLTKSKPQLAEVVQQINAAKKHVLVIVDNAEQLDDSCLETLLSQIKAQGEKGYFRVLLAADFTFCQRLNQFDTPEYENLIHTMEPGCLTEDEAKTYLTANASLIQQLGKAFTQQQMQSLHKATEGNIARINQMAVSLCNGKKPAQKTAKKRASFAFVASIAISGLAVGYLWQNHDSLYNTFVSKHLVKQTQLMPESNIATIDFANNARSKYYPSTITPFYVAATRQKLQPPPLTKIFASIFESEEEYTEGLGIVDKVLVIPKMLVKENQAAKQVLASQLVEVRFPKRPQSLYLGKAPGTLGRGYTIQIIACRNKAETQDFLKKYPLARQSAHLRKAKRKGLDWYVLTLGEYTNLQQAKAAMGQLPGDLSKLNPWIRPLSGLSRA